LKKDLKKLCRGLLKEDRNNAKLVVKMAELEYRLGGYHQAQTILESGLRGLSETQLKGEEGLSLYRAAMELEIREMVKLRTAERKENQDFNEESSHRNRLQWLLIMQGVTAKSFSPLNEQNKMSMLAQVEGATSNFSIWINSSASEFSEIPFFSTAPFLTPKFCDLVFSYGWLLNLSVGLEEALEVLQKVYDTIGILAKSEPSRFREHSLRLQYLQESIDKVCFDLIWFESLFDIKLKQLLRNQFLKFLGRHPGSGYFISRFSRVESSTSVISSIWREVTKRIVIQPDIRLLEQVCRLSIEKFLQVVDPNSVDSSLLSVHGLGFINRLSQLLEKQTKLVGVRHSPLLWRLLIWAQSVIQSSQGKGIEDDELGKRKIHSSQQCDALKTVLYRAIQDVPWCKALYMDTAAYLSNIGELYTTIKKEVTHGEGPDHEEDELVEPKYEEIPGTLEHITELIAEKELRLRLPLQELEVLIEP